MESNKNIVKNKIKHEVWRTCPEFYWIQGSSLGRVRTIDRYVSNGKGGNRFVKGQILAPHCLNNGYMQVTFSVDGKISPQLVHRIIASCFIPNPIGLPEVNHRNGDKTDNRLSNLEFCTHKYNMQYKEKHGVSSAEAVGCPIVAVNLKTWKILRFKTQLEASRKLGISQGNIGMVILGRYKYAGDYYFTKDTGGDLKIDKDKLCDIEVITVFRNGVFAIDLKTQEVLYFQSQAKASRELGVYKQGVNRVLKGQYKQAGGYCFVKEDNNTVEDTRAKFGDAVADRISELMSEKEIKSV